ncbi:hypothetical protein DIZ27_06780 [Streptomyces sp. NWU339]|uniref:hypothetical protein n=1 Tax=Streptomyces sp. NWU339 TaxID=2185284 RepID=UPI000D6733CF|nr:hypothetical protein [Streptomyces sp. NWU339]PWI11108.1 hypothetical protein DIZ27_06780 [Streptomyces sp. NWU339]
MPFPHAPRARSGPRRRSLFAVASTALLVTGCSSGSERPDTAAGSRPSPAERVRARAAGDSRELAERYDAVIAAHAGLAPRLRPLREEVVRHAKAFGSTATSTASAGAAGPQASPGSQASPSPSGAQRSASPTASGPATEKDALAGLAAAEREIADRRLEELLDAPAELARLLASVAAAGAAHVYLLTKG